MWRINTEDNDMPDPIKCSELTLQHFLWERYRLPCICGVFHSAQALMLVFIEYFEMKVWPGPKLNHSSKPRCPNLTESAPIWGLFLVNIFRPEDGDQGTGSAKDEDGDVTGCRKKKYWNEFFFFFLLVLSNHRHSLYIRKFLEKKKVCRHPHAHRYSVCCKVTRVQMVVTSPCPSGFSKKNCPWSLCLVQ